MSTSRSGRPGIPGLLASGLLLAAIATSIVALQWPRGQDPVPTEPTAAQLTDASAPSTSPSTEDAEFALWGTDQHGDPLRWDACKPVTFVLSTVDAPPHAEADVRTALAMLADASGLDLVLEGTTEERPDARRPLVERRGDGWRWRPVLIAWARPGTTDLPLTTLDRGVAVPVAVRDGDREGLVTGQVVMNAARVDLAAGFGDRSDAVGATLLHEIGHVLGLDHVDAVTQIMSEDPGSGPVRLGEGDLAGLRTIGADAGCLLAPAPASGRGLTAVP